MNLKRILLIIAGLVFLLFALAGALLPLVPGFVFFIISIICFALLFVKSKKK